MLVPWPGVEPVLPALGVQSLKHWTTREVPHTLLFYVFSFIFFSLRARNGLFIAVSSDWQMAGALRNVPLLLLLNGFSRVWLCATLWTGACQPPTPMGFSRQEYWGGLQFPPPEDLPDPCLLRLLHCRQILYRSIGEASYNNHACRQLEWLLSKSTNN